MIKISFRKVALYIKFNLKNISFKKINKKSINYILLILLLSTILPPLLKVHCKSIYAFLLLGRRFITWPYFNSVMNSLIYCLNNLFVFYGSFLASNVISKLFPLRLSKTIFLKECWASIISSAGYLSIILLNPSFLNNFLLSSSSIIFYPNNILRSDLL